jgi:4-hydroxybenzoate polyprenyltransferase
MMRVHQWVKNLLIFLPLVLSHSLSDIDKVMNSFYGFLLFSFAASGIYIFNDLIDLAHDRAHPVKARRQLASGEIPVLHGVILGFLLWSVALVTSFIYFDILFLLIIGYIILNFLYSSFLKKLVLIDVLVLAGFYTLRIIIGAVMAGVSMSYWLLTFSLFVFFSLALVKRYSEIAFHTEENSGVKGRGYHSEDKLITTILGVASGLMSILVMALYINDPHTRELYSHAAWLWVTIPALLYWMSRLWLLAHRKMITDDPMLFALKDIESYLTAIVLAFGFYMAV